MRTRTLERFWYSVITSRFYFFAFGIISEPWRMYEQYATIRHWLFSARNLSSWIHKSTESCIKKLPELQATVVKGRLYYKDQNPDGTDLDRERNEADRVF